MGCNTWHASVQVPTGREEGIENTGQSKVPDCPDAIRGLSLGKRAITSTGSRAVSSFQSPVSSVHTESRARDKANPLD